MKNACNQHDEGNAVEYYKETKLPMVRPKINFARAGIEVLLNLLRNSLITIALYHIVMMTGVFERVNIFVVFGLVSISDILIFSKKIVVFSIRVYQRYAPYRVRAGCLFIPNCSEYMILAIEKYGLISGVRRGVARCKRCHAPNGGIDYP